MFLMFIAGFLVGIAASIWGLAWYLRSFGVRWD